MKFIVRFALAIVLAVLGGTSSASAQDAINIADLILAVRQGLIEAQQRESKANLVPMFSRKRFRDDYHLCRRESRNWRHYAQGGHRGGAHQEGANTNGDDTLGNSRIRACEVKGE